jgi:hypothetical protein
MVVSWGKHLVEKMAWYLVVMRANVMVERKASRWVGKMGVMTDVDLVVLKAVLMVAQWVIYWARKWDAQLAASKVVCLDW